MDNLPHLRFIKSRTTGFTLVELVVVIIVIGVLVVSAYSQLGNNQGYAEYTYQSRIISALRNMQTRAMQDNRSAVCFQINFSTNPASFGPPLRDYIARNNSRRSCRSAIIYTNPDYISAKSDDEMSNDNVSLQARAGGSSISHIRFDSMGRPEASSGDRCTSDCVITLTGESSVKVCVGPEGYIRACE